MGTRGFLGFVADGQEKITYNHWDSYPSGLGLETLTWLREVLNNIGGPEALREAATALKMVDGQSKPTEAQIEQLKHWADTGVGGQSLDDWYCLLRRTQGSAVGILSAGYAVDSSEFPQDSLFAEWGYVIDMDNSTFEAFKGFQHHPHNLGRFAHRPLREPSYSGDQYYPVALAGAWSFNALPTNEDFIALLEGVEEEE